MTPPIEPVEIPIGQVARAVGNRAFERGRNYAREGRVGQVAWDRTQECAEGVVLGNGAMYRTVAYFARDRRGAVVFDGGDCTCPVGVNCKHVAALSITIQSLAASPAAASRQPIPAWEQTLRDVIDARSQSAIGEPLAIELRLTANDAGGGQLSARLLQPGRTGWVGASTTWAALDSAYSYTNYRADHVAVVRELYSLHRTAQARSTYHSYYAQSGKAIDITGCGPHLWSLLDEAARVDLALLQPGKAHRALPPARTDAVVIDVTQGPNGRAQVRARLLGIDDLEPMAFLGPDGHGLACVERSEDAQLTLVRLDRSVPVALQRMVLTGDTLDIPKTQRERFAVDVYPALQRSATIVSSDASFEPPEISEPALTLHVTYDNAGSAVVRWEWSYRIGDDERRVPFEMDETGFRDRDAERATVDATVCVDTGLERFGLLDDDERPVGGFDALLIGIESIRFTTESLPQMKALGNVQVDVDGKPPDFRDITDELEIGVSTQAIEGDRDWFDLGVTIRAGRRELPFAEVFVALASGESHMLLPDGTYFSLRDERLLALRILIDEARALNDPAAKTLRISRYQAGLWEEFAALGVVRRQARAWQQQIGGLLDLDVVPEHDPPPTLLAELRPYQWEGFAWLAGLAELGLGGILADDMGLGKTLQALALVCHRRERDPDGAPFLVVAPTSVVGGWVGEAARFAPKLRVEALTDTFAKSGRTIADVATADIVVTTYTLLRLEAEAYHDIDWAGVILDEAQYVKNHQAKTYRCVRELDAPLKIALSGTPMENNLMELWSILSITAPGLFPDPKRFNEHYVKPIERDGDRDRLAALRRRIKPLVKRRTKEHVARDLPPKQETTLDLELHPRHRKIYDTYLQRERQKILGLIDDFDRNRFTVLRSITLLRQLSLHPGLVEDRHRTVPSAKLEALAEHIDEVVAEGHRALVFSQFTSFLKEVRAHLDAERIPYCYLDGRTRKRAEVVERFKTGTDPVFLISLKAGGFGLNLTEADYCFLLDPWWNPAAENQAIDRTHRIGQTRPVMVYRLVSRDTIEEKVVALAQRKAALFTGVMDDGDLFATTLTAEDIRALVE